jgi:hypothetical protein
MAVNKSLPESAARLLEFVGLRHFQKLGVIPATAGG